MVTEQESGRPRSEGRRLEVRSQNPGGRGRKAEGLMFGARIWAAEDGRPKV
jgi:hypothetical protein